MKNIIKNNYFIMFILCLIIYGCKYKIDEKKNQSIQKPKDERLTNSIVLKTDTISSHVYYSLKIKNRFCNKVDTIFKTTLDESSFHTLDFFEKDRVLYYEYTSVRPVSHTSLYFDEKYEKIDSIKGGVFIFEKEEFDIFLVDKNINICDVNIIKYFE